MLRRLKNSILFMYIIFSRECLSILNNRKWENNAHKIHFESGVRTGIGAFNLVCGINNIYCTK